MIIGSNLLWNMGMDISYLKQQVEWLNGSIPLKERDTLWHRDICKSLYDMHMDSPLIKQMEERSNQILNSDYSKVDIAEMVSELEISDTSKNKLQVTLEKFPELFGGGLG